MKKRIIQMGLGLTALATSFFPQTAEACEAICKNDEGEVVGGCQGNWICFCWGETPVCIDWP